MLTHADVDDLELSLAKGRAASRRVVELCDALQRIIDRANTDELGTSKVRNMEKIARAALAKASPPTDSPSAVREVE